MHCMHEMNVTLLLMPMIFFKTCGTVSICLILPSLCSSLSRLNIMCICEMCNNLSSVFLFFLIHSTLMVTKIALCTSFFIICLFNDNVAEMHSEQCGTVHNETLY